MSAVIVSRQPIARCYQCGSPGIAMVCHHCGQLMCNTHGPAQVEPSPGLENPEFEGLSLEKTPLGVEGVHCEECRHAVRNYLRVLVLPAIPVALAGLVLIGIDQTAIGVLVFLIGAAVAALGYWLYRERYVTVLEQTRPLIPLVPQCNKISIRERIKGQITFDADGRYVAERNEQRGGIVLPLAFRPGDQERCEMYRQYHELAIDDTLQFHAGFVVLDGAINATFDSTIEEALENERVLSLIGAIADQPFLQGSDSAAPGGNEWQNHFLYEIPPHPSEHDNGAPQLPIRLIPSLVPETAQQQLELELQWAPSYFDNNDLRLSRIEALELLTPGELGQVEMVKPTARTSRTVISSGDAPEEHGFSIEWKKIAVTRRDRRARRKSFYVRFPTKIEPSVQLRGRIEVGFDGALSGLKGIQLYSPLGRPLENIETDSGTVVEVDFELDLATLRYQESVLSQEEIVRKGVIPDHVMVTQLIEAISREGFYTKRVIENPARTSKAGAHVLNRFWDLAGRKYDGVYPMDFHLVLTGEEVYGDDGRAQSGKTEIEVTAQGTATDEQMQAQIANLKEQLVRLIEDTLEEMPVMKASPPRAPVTPTPQVDDSQISERVQTLRERLDKLEEALIEQRVSEETYTALREKYEQELEELLSTP